MDVIVQHVQDHLALYAVSGAIALPLVYFTRNYTLPFLHYTIEYGIYCVTAHYVLGGIVRLGSWYHSETSFKNYDGTYESEVIPFTTPLGMDFWQKELYYPPWLFYVEVGIAVALLYVVVVVRPTGYSKNRYRGRQNALKKRRKKQFDPVAYAIRTRTMAQRSLLRRIRSGR